MTDVKSGKSYTEVLKEKSRAIRIFGEESPSRNFNFKSLADFVKRAEEVKETFKHADPIQPKSSY